MIELNCPACGKLLRIADQFRGQTGKCTGCGGAVSVPRIAPPLAHVAVSSHNEPMTEDQREYLKSIGTPFGKLHNLTRSQATALIEESQKDPVALAELLSKSSKKAAGKKVFYGCLSCGAISAFLIFLVPTCAVLVTSSPTTPPTPKQAPVRTIVAPEIAPAPQITPSPSTPVPVPPPVPRNRPMHRTAPEVQQEQTVYIATSGKGKKYHVSSCHTIREGNRGVSISEAISLGYGPCAICDPW